MKICVSTRPPRAAAAQQTSGAAGGSRWRAPGLLPDSNLATLHTPTRVGANTQSREPHRRHVHTRLPGSRWDTVWWSKTRTSRWLFWRRWWLVPRRDVGGQSRGAGAERGLLWGQHSFIVVTRGAETAIQSDLKKHSPPWSNWTLRFFAGWILLHDVKVASFILLFFFLF